MLTNTTGRTLLCRRRTDQRVSARRCAPPACQRSPHRFARGPERRPRARRAASPAPWSAQSAAASLLWRRAAASTARCARARLRAAAARPRRHTRRGGPPPKSSMRPPRGRGWTPSTQTEGPTPGLGEGQGSLRLPGATLSGTDARDAEVGARSSRTGRMRSVAVGRSATRLRGSSDTADPTHCSSRVVLPSGEACQARGQQVCTTPDTRSASAAGASTATMFRGEPAPP